MIRVAERKTRIDRAQFLADMAEQYRDATRITLVMGHLNTRQPGALYEAYPPAQARVDWQSTIRDGRRELKRLYPTLET